MIETAPSFSAVPTGVHDPATAPTMWGRWANRAQVEVLGSTRKTRRVVLLTNLVWTDIDGQRHVVPEGRMSDGATIPFGVWWLMGGRLALDYIRAAFVHDFWCETRPPGSSSHEAAVRFYNGLRADGMGYHQARWCFRGVVKFGPQWGAKPLLFNL